jgi:hypothetical protein
MFHKRHLNSSSSSRGRRGSFVVLGAAAAGMLLAALGELAAAPTAGADVTDLINAIESSDAAGQEAFVDALSSFSGGDAAEGLGYSFVGLDDYLIASSDDLLVNGYAVLTGADDSASFAFGDFVLPKALSDISAEVSGYLAAAETDWTDASNDFASGDVFSGLIGLSVAGENLTESSQVVLVGLADLLTPSV